MPTQRQGPAAKAAAAVQMLRDLIWCPPVPLPPPDPSPYGGGETPRDPAPAWRSICSHMSRLVNHPREQRPPTARSLPRGEPQAGMGRAGSVGQKRCKSSRSTKEQSRNAAMPVSSGGQRHGCSEGRLARARWQRAVASWAGSPTLRLAQCPQRRGWSSPKAVPVYSSSRAPWRQGWFCSAARGSCHQAGAKPHSAAAGAVPAQDAVAGAAPVPPRNRAMC